ncbi:MAG: histidinol-phosphate transaminase [Cytophagia bacterium]|nr:MAG: histidinol-phosphate transaminase [Cytophagia bacterium]TAG44026.1 MAG: histidinol-phosphate transaminase [Cytophagia bacterium]TAH31019.1 MAG: histidinol-phosphate transaminase [Cytophagales bacterium]
MFDLQKITRKNIINLKPYSSARDEYEGNQGIFLDANENSFGALIHNEYNLNRYPDPHQKKLKEKIAEIESINSENIFLGNGSDEAIDLLFRAFAEPSIDTVLYCPPTYGMYEVSANINAITPIEVPLTQDFELDIEKIRPHLNNPTLKLIFLCSPNNPTGNILNRENIMTILKNFQGIVVIDEAYQDFSKEVSWIKEIENYKNLVVLKTFSKSWGMANLRLGMAFASPEIIHIYNKIKPPYNINGETQRLVLEGLTDHKSRKYRAIDDIIEEREKLSIKLKNLSFVQKVYKSDTNFLLIKVNNANQLYNYLISKQIIIRNRHTTLLCENCVRITIGTNTENMMLMKHLLAFENSYS